MATLIREGFNQRVTRPQMAQAILAGHPTSLKVISGFSIPHRGLSKHSRPLKRVPKTFVVVTADQQLISARVTEQELFRLRGMTEEGRPPRLGEKTYLFPDGQPEYNQVLVRRHKRKDVWVVAAGVDPALVLAELRRSISRQISSSEANQTIDRARYATETRAGRLFWHDEGTCTYWHPQAEREVYDAKFSVPIVRIKFSSTKNRVCKNTVRLERPITAPIRSASAR